MASACGCLDGYSNRDSVVRVFFFSSRRRHPSWPGDWSSDVCSSDLGALDGVRLFGPLTITKFTEPQSPPDQAILRGLGWDIDSPHSGNRGELFPIGSFGHTGFTGTSMWMDPATNTYVILLANSVHPDLRPAITALRSK